MKTSRKILVGSGMAVFVTLASFVAPGGMINADQTSGSVVRPTPSAGVTPFPATGTVPVVTPSPTKSSVRPSGAVKKSAAEKTHESANSAPYASPESVRKEARIIAAHAAKLNAAAKKRPKPKVTTFKGYSFCGWSVKAAQRCIDQGKLVRYKPSGVNTLAGHNYMGWYWIDDLPNGRKVVIKSGELKGTYKVYGHAKVYNKKFPRSGLGADVALQTCEDSGIGFSFLRRV